METIREVGDVQAVDTGIKELVSTTDAVCIVYSPAHIFIFHLG